MRLSGDRQTTPLTQEKGLNEKGCIHQTLK